MEKSIINELYLEIKNLEKNAMEKDTDSLVDYMKLRSMLNLMGGKWGWFHLTGANVEIKMAMDDFNKSEEYEQLYQEYKNQNNKEVMGYWGMSEVVEFLAQLVVKHTDILKKIKDKYYKKEVLQQ
ncbi:hypothetical protein IJJ97_05330 [bacterium]|nr:hypothetical protein [bacterium]